MKSEVGQQIMTSFFDALKRTMEEMPPDKVQAMSKGKHFTDIQMKKLYDLTGHPTSFYCINFAMITEDEAMRAQVFTLLQLLVSSIGGYGKGFQSVEKKLRGYSAGEHVAL